MKKFAIYTAIIGGYDKIRQPEVVNSNFDYILFSDQIIEQQIGVWQVHKVNFHINDQTRIARYIKTHPEELLKDYKATLWIDACLLITSSFIYDRFLQLYEGGVLFATMKHPYRDCIYDEAYKVYGLDKELIIFNWCCYLRSINYPRHNGLYETGMVYRCNNPKVQKVDELWWECILNYSRRDQLSLNYVIWKEQIELEYFLPENEYVHCSSHIQLKEHGRLANKIGRRSINISLFEHARNRCRIGIEEKIEQFREFHYWLYGLDPIIAKILLYLWGGYVVLRYGLVIKIRGYRREKRKNK